MTDMLNQVVYEAHHNCGSWKASRITEFESLLDSMSRIFARIEMKRNEITGLRRAVDESARINSRRQPHAQELSDLLDTVFKATAPCHLDAARSIAAKMREILDLAVKSLGELPESERDGTLEEKTAEALLFARRTERVLAGMMADADTEIQSLQSLFLALSVGTRDGHL